MSINLIIFIILLNYILLEPICKGGENHCLRCNTLTNLCIKCDKDIYIPNEDGGCKNSEKCVFGNHYCFECDEEGHLCKICEDGYYPDDNGGCSYTNYCQISFKGECIKCKENYILIGIDDNLNEGIKICKSINSEDFKNCKLINMATGKCMECNDNYYLNKGDNRCSTTENCNESNFSICKECVKGYYLEKRLNECIKQDDSFFGCKETLDGKKCDKCEDNYFLDEENKCTLSNYCSKSGGALHSCQKCIEGYYLSEYDKSCTREENCYYGHWDTGICFTCKDDYYLEEKTGQCFSNKEENDFKNCKFSKNFNCYQCEYGYYIGSDNKCSNSNHCYRSEDGKCLECIDNFDLGLDNICNVKHCIYSNSNYNYNDCIECEDGFYFDKFNVSCKSSLENEIFNNCKFSIDGKRCHSCKNDFYLNRTDYLCYSNKEKNDFYKCTISSEGNYCIDCEEEYYIARDHKCTSTVGCKETENENRCRECSEYYCLDENTGKCLDNDFIEEEDKLIYFRCIRTNKEGTQCEKCVEGFSVNEKGLCVNDTLCEERKEDGTCIKCQNYEDSFFCLNNIYECVEVLPFGENCLECNDIFDFDNCTKCKNGYELDENQICIESNNNL